jgi:hypothetical protein
MLKNGSQALIAKDTRSDEGTCRSTQGQGLLD